MAFLGNPLMPEVAPQLTRRPSSVFWLTLRCLMPFPTRRNAGGATVSGNSPLPWAWDYLTNLTRLLSVICEIVLQACLVLRMKPWQENICKLNVVSLRNVNDREA